MSSEDKLLSRARMFDLDALAEIYDIYSPGLYRYSVRLLGCEIQAEDCVSETFSRFLKALQNGGGPEDHLQAYLYRIAHNWITDHYRKQAPLMVELSEDYCDENDPLPVQEVDDRMQKNRVRNALRVLTPDQRQVIILRFLEGWENSDIAHAVEKPVGAVKALQHRAINTLRRMLIQEEEDIVYEPGK